MARTIDDAQLQRRLDARDRKSLIAQKIFQLWVCESLDERYEIWNLGQRAGGCHSGQVNASRASEWFWRGRAAVIKGSPMGIAQAECHATEPDV